jgi:hypothetical protein
MNLMSLKVALEKLANGSFLKNTLPVFLNERRHRERRKLRSLAQSHGKAQRHIWDSRLIEGSRHVNLATRHPGIENFPM